MWFLYPKSCWIWKYSVERSTESIQKFCALTRRFGDRFPRLPEITATSLLGGSLKGWKGPEVVYLFRVVNSSTLTLTCIIKKNMNILMGHKISISIISITHSATLCNSVPNFQKLKTAKFCGVLHYHGNKQRNFPETLRNLLHKRQLPAS